MQNSYHLMAVILACATAPLQAQFKGAPDSLSHQGLLRDGTGIPVPDASYSIVFTLYDDATAGSSIWTETQSVATSGGIFNVWLGSVNPLSEVAFDKPMWLGTKVGADPEMAPRSPLTSAPYALSLRNLRVEPGVSDCVGYCGPNLIGGFEGNAVSAGVVGATVFGGGEFFFDISAAPKVESDMRSEVVSGLANEVTGNFGVVSGGYGNSAGTRAAVSGGENNEASGGASSVGGGVGNVASGVWATVPGGLHNNASGDVSFAAGHRAKAVNDYTFVWADQTAADFTSTASNQFLIRASGGVGIGTASPASDLHVKQSASAIGRGIRIENTGNTNYWRVYTDNVNDYNFVFNGNIIGWIDEATGEYVDNV